MNKKVIYTCCIGNYDSLQQPLAVDKDFDYICFSDKIPSNDTGIWKYKKIGFTHQEKTRISRYPKIMPHEVLTEYEYSVYVDANIQITDKRFYDYINDKIYSGCLIAQVNHCFPPINCTYDEIIFAYKCSRVDFIPALKQILYLKFNHFPRHYGLYENNLIFRRHNAPIVISISRQWWEEYLKLAPRDQFSLMYVYWKKRYMPELLFNENTNTRNSKVLKYNQHLWEQKRFSLLEVIKHKLHEYTYQLLKIII